MVSIYIYKRNTNNLGKPNSYPMYIGKIHKKKASFFYIYSKTHIFLGKMSNFYIYIRKTYTTIWAKYKRNVQTKKCYFYYRENTIYIGWGKIQKKKEGLFYIYKKTPIISVSIIYSQNTTIWARYKRKERVLYRKNTPYIRIYIRKIPIWGYIKAHCQI